MRCLLLVLAAASAAAAAASTTTDLAFLRSVTFRTGMIILELLIATVSIYAVSGPGKQPS